LAIYRRAAVVEVNDDIERPSSLTAVDRHHTVQVECSFCQTRLVTSPRKRCEVLRWVYVYLSVCLSVRSRHSKTTRSNFTNFYVHVAYGRGLMLLWRHCDTLCISGFMDDVMFFTNCPCGASCVFLSGHKIQQA